MAFAYSIPTTTNTSTGASIIANPSAIAITGSLESWWAYRLPRARVDASQTNALKKMLAPNAAITTK
jgi:hypothetical protein